MSASVWDSRAQAYRESEAHREGSHVRNYTEAEWRALFEDAGLVVEEVRRVDKTMRFDPWLERSDCRGAETEQVRALVADRIDGDRITLHRIALNGVRR